MIYNIVYTILYTVLCMLYYILYTILYTLITLTAILTGFISIEGEIDVVKYISALFIKNINIKFQIKKSIINYHKLCILYR